ncbi:hypothetical protein CA13_56920 [Planctomycetes bacterium CA13]|uniref:Uncharacterized protein n=1 Tax=Novipirellula herctigrandis TaxID=2527986 RepID=A0A5C5ZAS1_9BACT|nr:hypothetical protein CA13_56920 [Planctomycetes bacterium CA13]
MDKLEKWDACRRLAALPLAKFSWSVAIGPVRNYDATLAPNRHDGLTSLISEPTTLLLGFETAELAIFE